MEEDKFDFNNAITIGGGIVDTVFGFFGQSLKNKSEEIKGSYAVQLAKIKQDTAGNEQTFAVAMAKLNETTKARTDALNAEGNKRVLIVIAALVAFLGILATTVLVLRRQSPIRLR